MWPFLKMESASCRSVPVQKLWPWRTLVARAFSDGTEGIRDLPIFLGIERI